MLQVGLLRLYKENHPYNLLQTKINIFAFINKHLFSASSALFPNAGQILNLANKKFGPSFCAADDLDLFNTYAANAEQIEFQDFKNPGVQNLNNTLDFHPYQEKSNTHYSHSAPVQIRSNSNNNNIGNNGTNNFNQISHHGSHESNQGLVSNFQQIHYQEFQPMPPAQVSVSHYNLNMNGVNGSNDFINDSYFNDFMSNSVNSRDSIDYQSVYGSSSESYVSPLDDEFYKKLSPGTIISEFDSNQSITNEPITAATTATNRKRRLESSPSPNVNFYDVDTIFNDYLMDNSKYNEQSASVPSVVKQEEPESFSIPQPSQTHSQDESDSPIVRRDSNPIKKVKLEGDLSTAKYTCSHCDAKFKVKGYLTRHLKKHNSSKAFMCPFYQENATNVNACKKNVFAGTKCHPTGGFSRRDTYKTHLKALHFIYPPGTKSNERNSIGGRCAGCFKYFENNHRWLDEHIEKGTCEGWVKTP
ncbi:transcriptional regulator Stp3p [[Candida] anglica]|uniref:Transcriptional regulator Stp3p n=1 Tax=[Candida] anglica TaxID=148631 RepID=A0ABP0E9Z2_9ASCO